MKSPFVFVYFVPCADIYIFGRAVGHLKLLDRKTEQEDRIKEFGRRNATSILEERKSSDITIRLQQ